VVERFAKVHCVVRVVPRGGADRVDGVVAGTLRVRVAAPPVDDQANRSLVGLLARELGVPPSAVRVLTGATARTKTVSVEGIDPSALAARWPGLTS